MNVHCRWSWFFHSLWFSWSLQMPNSQTLASYLVNVHPRVWMFIPSQKKSFPSFHSSFLFHFASQKLNHPDPTLHHLLRNHRQNSVPRMTVLISMKWSSTWQTTNCVVILSRTVGSRPLLKVRFWLGPDFVLPYICFGGGVRPASCNPYPISDQNMWFFIPYFRPDPKIDTLFQTYKISTRLSYMTSATLEGLPFA